MANDSGNGTNVTYSIKELLGQINDKLDRIAFDMNSKASRAELDKVIARMELAEKGIYTIQLMNEERRQANDSRGAARRWLAALAFPILASTTTGIVVAIITVVFQAKSHG